VLAGADGGGIDFGVEAAADVGLAVAQHPALRGVEAVVRDRFEQVGGRGLAVA